MNTNVCCTHDRVPFFLALIQLTDDPMDIAKKEPKRAAPRIACFPGEQALNISSLLKVKYFVLPILFHKLSCCGSLPIIF